MHRIVLFAILSVLNTIPSQGFAGTDEYWISYSTFSEGQLDYPKSGPKFLMKIDVLGNVLIPPQAVIKNSSVYISPVNGANALSHGNGQTLQMWFPAKRDLGGGTHPIFKAGINKNTLNLISFNETQLVETGDAGLFSLPLTQRKFNNFILLERRSNGPNVGYKLIGHDLSNKRPNWFLLDCPDGSTCDFALSADGRAFFYKKSDGQNSDLFLQLLNSAGMPTGEPEKIAEGTAFLGDVSNIIQGDKRYCVYRGKSPSLFIQLVDSKTGKKLADRKKIGSLASSPMIDPLGRFVIFTTSGPGGGFLKFQALDALGNASGSPRVLISEGFGGGLDILKDR